MTSGGDPLAAALVALRGVQAGGRDAMARAARRASSGADPQFQSYTMRNWASFSAGPAAARREMRSYSHGTGLGQQSQECASPRGVYREGARAQSHCFGGICVMDASGVEEQEEEEHARRRRAHQQQGRHCSADGELEDVADGGAYSGGHGQVRGASGMTSEMGSEKGSWRDPGDGREGEELAVPQSKSGPPYGSKSGTGEPGVLLDEQVGTGGAGGSGWRSRLHAICCVLAFTALPACCCCCFASALLATSALYPMTGCGMDTLDRHLLFHLST